MEMKTIYKVFLEKNEEGKWFEAYQVASDFPSGEYGWTEVPIPEGLKFPKWNYDKYQWEEDSEQLEVESSKHLIDEVAELNKTILEMSEMLLKGGLV